LLDSLLQSLKLQSRIERFSVAILILSGILHTIPFLLGGKEWEDPTSFRKAILFGISTGVTLYSCLWTLRLLNPKSNDQRLSHVLCLSLVAEVALITLQCWRSKESHFNSNTLFDERIEQAMLLLISIAMWYITQLTWRTWTRQFQSNVPATAKSAAIWGMSFLLLSGIIGFIISYLGYFQIEQGASPYRWPNRETSLNDPQTGQGVLKFPHGAALHAIQILSFVAWAVRNADSRLGLLAVRLTAYAHLLWMLFAVYQTAQGRSRFHVDQYSLLLMIATILCSSATMIIVIKSMVTYYLANRRIV